MIGLQQPLRVRDAALLVEANAVDDIAAVGGEGDAINGLVTRRARLGELPGHATDLYHRAPGGKCHHHGHLQQHLKGVTDLGCGKFGEAFGAVPALKQKRTPLGNFSELPAQLAGFAGKYQGRQARQVCFDALQMLGIRIDRLLLDGFVSPARGAPGLVHPSLSRCLKVAPILPDAPGRR